MAISLGDIQFGLGADTRRLQKSVTAIRNFGSRVEQMAKQSSDAAKKTTRALLRQEQATLKALQTTVRFNNRIREQGLEASKQRSMLSQSTRAFNQFTQTMTKGEVDTLNFSRAQSRLAADFSRLDRKLQATKQNLDSTGAATISIQDKMRNLGSTAVLAVGPLSGIGARINALGAIANRSTLGIAALLAALTSAGVVLSKLSSAAVRTAFELDKVRARFEAFTDTAQEGQAQFTALTNLAHRTGTEVLSLARNYTNLQAAAQGTGIEGQKTVSMFEDITFAAAKFQLTAAEVDGVFRAITQILSKGTVQAEELRGQLGERLPGAFGIASRAMGVTTEELNDLLRAGEVVSDEFLPKFARELRKSLGGTSDDEVDSLRASFNRLQNAITLFNKAFDDTFRVSLIFKAGLEDTAKVIEFATRNIVEASVAAGALLAALLAITAPVIITGIGAIIGMVQRLSKALTAVSVLAAASGIGGILTVALRVGAVLAGLAFAIGAASQAQAQATEVRKAATATVDTYVNSLEKETKTIEAQGDALENNIRAQIELLRARQRVLKATAEAAASSLANEGPSFRPDSITNAFQDFFAAKNAKQGITAISEAIKELEANLKRLEAARSESEEVVQRRLSDEAVAALATLDKQIERLRKEADATVQVAGTLEKLQAEFAREDALTKIADDLEKAGVQGDEFKDALGRARNALIELQAARQVDILVDAQVEIDRLKQLSKAALEGEDAMKALEKSFDVQDQLEAFRTKLLAAGGDVNVVTEQVNALAVALRLLDNAIQINNAASALEAAADETRRLAEETNALRGGKEVFESFQNTQTITEDLQKLRETLVATGASETEVVNALDSRRRALEDNIKANKDYRDSLKSTRGSQKGFNKDLREAERIFLSTLTPQEQYIEGYRRLQQLFDEGFFRDFGGVVTFDRAVQRLKDRLADTGTIADSVENAFSDTFASMLTGIDSVSDAVRALGRDLVALAVRRAAGNLFEGLFDFLVPSAHGNVFNQGRVVPFARGGITDRPTFFPMPGGGAGLMGESGPEAILPLKRTSSGDLGVIAQGSRGGSGGGDSNVIINIFNETNSEVEQRESTDNNGNRVVDLIIRTVNQGAVEGQLDKGLGTAFGLTRSRVRR